MNPPIPTAPILHHPRQPTWDRWFRRVRAEFCPLFKEHIGKPITYVEVGCWAGASGEWVSRNVLTHPDSQGFGIDPYPAERRHPQSEVDAIKACSAARVAHLGDRWAWIYQTSHVGLRQLAEHPRFAGRTIDVLYLDGDHRGWAVMLDFCFAWPMLRAGSTVIFDDYFVSKAKPHPIVKDCYHAILANWGDMVQEVGKHRRQRAIKVVKHE